MKAVRRAFWRPLRLSSLALLVVFGAMCQNSGSLSGSTVIPDGTAFSGATVRYERLKIYTRSSIEEGYRVVRASGDYDVAGTLVTDSQGGFNATNLPDGDYQVCISAASYLDTCKWGAGTLLTITNGAAISLGQTVLAPGAPVTILINDPMALVTPAATQILGTNLIVQLCLLDNSYSYVVDSVSSVPGGVAYTVLAPLGQSFKLWMYSSDLSLTDSTGRFVNAGTGSNIPFQVPSDGSSVSFTFSAGAATPVQQQP